MINGSVPAVTHTHPLGRSPVSFNSQWMPLQGEKAKTRHITPTFSLFPVTRFKPKYCARCFKSVYFHSTLPTYVFSNVHLILSTLAFSTDEITGNNGEKHQLVWRYLLPQRHGLETSALAFSHSRHLFPKGPATSKKVSYSTQNMNVRQ